MLSFMYKKLSLFVESALPRRFCRQITNLISCFSLVPVLLQWCCVFPGTLRWCSRRSGLHGCSVQLQFCIHCIPSVLRAGALPAPVEPLEGAVHVSMGCVLSHQLGAHIHRAAPAGKAAAPREVNLWNSGSGIAYTGLTSNSFTPACLPALLFEVDMVCQSSAFEGNVWNSDM